MTTRNKYLKEALHQCGGIIGLSDELEPYGGCDTALYEASNQPPLCSDGSSYDKQQSAEDRCCLADYMIDLWCRYRHAIEGSERLWDVGYDSMPHQIAAQKQLLESQAANFKARVADLQAALMRRPKVIEVPAEGWDPYWSAVSDSVAAIASAIAKCPEDAICARRPLKEALEKLMGVLADQGRDVSGVDPS